MNPSVIREILKVTERPGIISFAGGLPSPKTFPIAEFAAACEKMLQGDGPAALQPVLGFDDLMGRMGLPGLLAGGNDHLGAGLP